MQCLPSSRPPLPLPRARQRLPLARPRAGAPVDGPDFAQVLKGAIEQVSQAQVDARKMAEDFATGQGNANLQDVMINLQKASLSFQQMTQVRNKLVSAYRDIMNTQV